MLMTPVEGPLAESRAWYFVAGSFIIKECEGTYGSPCNSDAVAPLLTLPVPTGNPFSRIGSHCVQSGKAAEGAGEPEDVVSSCSRFGRRVVARSLFRDGGDEKPNDT